MNERLLMEQAFLARTDLEDRNIAVSFEELHPVLRDIVHYFEVNLNEPQNILILNKYSRLEYWKYLSISWKPPENAESARYAWLCERGCLALLNGMSLDFLTDQLVGDSDFWLQRKAMAHSALPYLKHYEPSDELLIQGREFLIKVFEFIEKMTPQDLDDEGMLGFDARPQGPWFTRNIVGDYFRSTAQLDFG
jgi:hypothetical protein